MFSKTDIEKYFIAEKQESLLFIIIGILAIVAGVILLAVLKTNFYRGTAIPLIAVGLLLGIVGYTVYNRCDEDRKRNVYAYDMNPSLLKNQELPRMQKVMKNFEIYRYIEMTLAIIGIGLFFFFRENVSRECWKGLGVGLIIMTLIALAADYFAEKRGAIYIEGLRNFITTNKL